MIVAARERNHSRRPDEHATANDLFFVRWLAFGTGTSATFHFSGVDRVRLRDRPVAENVIVFDTGELRELTGHDIPWRDAGGARCP